MTSEPMFPLPPDEHRTYVRVVELPNDLYSVALECVCRVCYFRSPHVRVFYSTAWADGVRHRAAVAREQGLAWSERESAAWEVEARGE